MSTKKVTITLTEDHIEKAENLSILILGRKNKSGLIAYLINKADKEQNPKS